MEERTQSQRFLMAVGMALVLLGLWFIVDGVIAPMIAPLRHVTELAGDIAFPLALIVVGAFIITRGRKGESPSSYAERGERRLYRSRTNRVVTGLLGGVAALAGMDAGIVRVLFVLFTILAGGMWGVLLYVVGSLLVPEMPSSYIGATPVPPAAPGGPDATAGAAAGNAQ